ncbi:MAG: hypothetical protein JO171_17245, partial [Paludibacterium sp.]
GRLDAVLLTHDQHIDNLDHAGRAMLPSVPVTYTTPAGAARLGDLARGLAPFETVALDAGGTRLWLTATPARHGPEGIEPISGDVTGFLLGVDAPGDTLYVSGDTVWYDGIAEIARRFSPRVIMLFTGAAQPRGRFHMTMNSNDAIAAAHAFAGAQVVTVHNEGWGHFKESAAELAASFATLGIAERLRPLERGAPLRL